jgi:hypothetical protein
MMKLNSILLLVLVGLSDFAVQGMEEDFTGESRELKTTKTPKTNKAAKKTKSKSEKSGKKDKKSKSKKDKKTKKDKKSSKSSEVEVEPPTEIETGEVVILTTAVCAPDCAGIDPTTPAFLLSIAEFVAPDGVDPSTVSVDVASVGPCGACSRRRELESGRLLQGAGETEIDFAITSTDPDFTADAVSNAVAENIDDLAAIAATVQPGATISPDSISTAPGTLAPTVAPLVGTPSPAGRKLEESLFEKETKSILEDRQQHVYDEEFKVLQQLNTQTRMERQYEVLSDIMYDEDLSSMKHDHENKRAIVAYSAPTSMDIDDPKQSMYHTNFLYFLDNAIDCTKHATVIITTEEVAEAYHHRIEELNEELCSDSQYSIEIILRVDKCYDMESMATFFRETDITQYDLFLYVNCGMVGPKTERDEHWTETFASRLSDKVKLTGVSINMSFYPHVQSMALATDRVGIDIIKNSDVVYDCGVMNDHEMTEEERWKIIDRYEIGMSKAIIESGYTINSLTGALGKSITINKEKIDEIKKESKDANELYNEEQQVRNGFHWTDDEHTFILPLGDDIWNGATIRTIGDGKLPSWSDFIFYKASRGNLLPDIFEEIEYNDPTIEVIEDYGEFSLTMLAEPNRDICEEAKYNFREASKLGVIITGYEHSGTTMVAQLIKSAPGLFGGFECGLALIEEQRRFYDWLTWTPQNDLWGLNDASRDIVVNASCMAERYNNLHKYSPLFHYDDHKQNYIVDKAPRYLHRLMKVMDETPGVPVIITRRDEAQLRESYRVRGYSDHFINTKIAIAGEQLDEAMKTYPGRIKIVDTSKWTTDPNKVMEDTYNFLGLEWKSEYLTLNALNRKRLPGSVVSKPFITKTVASKE